MKKKYTRYILIALVLLIFLCILIYKYFLFTNDTAKFHSYLNQADGIQVLIFDDGAVAINTEIPAKDELYTKIREIFATVRLFPSPFPYLEKMLTGHTYMIGSTDTDLTMYITLLQDSQPLHTIFLGGSNVIYLDQRAYFVGDFLNASELQIMNKVMSLFGK